MTNNTPIDFSLQERKKLSGVGLRTIFKLEEIIGLTEEDFLKILGKPNKTQYKEWRRAAMAKESVVLPSDTLNRVRSLLLVYKHVSLKWPKNPEKIYSWLTTPHSAPIFQKKSPISLIGDEDVKNAINAVRYVESFSNVPDAQNATPKPVRRKKKVS